MTGLLTRYSGENGKNTGTITGVLGKISETVKSPVLQDQDYHTPGMRYGGGNDLNKRLIFYTRKKNCLHPEW